MREDARKSKKSSGKTGMNVQNWPSLEGLGRHPALETLVSEHLGGEAIDAFLEGREFPLAEPGTLTFAWRGEADRLHLVRWIHAGVDRRPFARLAGSDLWLLRLPVEDGGRFEYKLAIGRDGHEELVVDPRNPQRAGDPFGENSVARTLGYERPEWSLPRGAPAGRIEASRSRARPSARRATSGVPAGGLRSRAGLSAGGRARRRRLRHLRRPAGGARQPDRRRARSRPVIAALIQTRDRLGEYSGSRQHARLPRARAAAGSSRRAGVSPRPRASGCCSAQASGRWRRWSTAFRYPGVFGGLVLKSGSFILDEGKLRRRPHPVFHRIARVMRALRRAPPLPPTRAFVSTGELEGLADENRALASFLRERGVDVLFKSAWDGHHWHNWRDQLRDGLRWVLRPGEDQTG